MKEGTEGCELYEYMFRKCINHYIITGATITLVVLAVPLVV